MLNNGEAFTTVRIDKIEIPMIQRDYAQGRMGYYNKGTLRQLNTTGDNFISELFDFLTADNPKIWIWILYMGRLRKLKE